MKHYKPGDRKVFVHNVSGAGVALSNGTILMKKHWFSILRYVSIEELSVTKDGKKYWTPILAISVEDWESLNERERNVMMEFGHYYDDHPAAGTSEIEMDW